MEKIKLGIYKHYKGKNYRVIGLAKHSETLEELVVYKPLYKTEEFDIDLMWVRPKKMFFEDVIINGKKIPRFKYINN